MRPLFRAHLTEDFDLQRSRNFAMPMGMSTIDYNYTIGRLNGYPVPAVRFIKLLEDNDQHGPSAMQVGLPHMNRSPVKVRFAIHVIPFSTNPGLIHVTIRDMMERVLAYTNVRLATAPNHYFIEGETQLDSTTGWLFFVYIEGARYILADSYVEISALP